VAPTKRKKGKKEGRKNIEQVICFFNTKIRGVAKCGAFA
jgi:hypothetical protein